MKNFRAFIKEWGIYIVVLVNLVILDWTMISKFDRLAIEIHRVVWSYMLYNEMEEEDIWVQKWPTKIMQVKFHDEIWEYWQYKNGKIVKKVVIREV